MELNCFNFKLGRSQGRLPCGADFVFVLGDDQPGEFHEIKVGDYTKAVQETDLIGVKLVRVSGNIMVPDSRPANPQWVVAIIVDDIPHTRLTCLSGRSGQIADMAANVSKRTGVHRVGVRLSRDTYT